MRSTTRLSALPPRCSPPAREDTSYTVSAADLLAGLSDAEGDTLAIANLAASNGSVARQRRRNVHRHAQPLNFNGAVTLTYDVLDGNGGSIAGATQSYTVTAVNDAPTGMPTAVLANGTEDTAYTVSAADLLAGFADVDRDTLAVANLAASNGTWPTTATAPSPSPRPQLQRPGDPHLRRARRQRRQRQRCHPELHRHRRQRRAHRHADRGAANGTEDTAYTVSAADLLAGFADVDGDTLVVANLAASNGSVADNGDGTFTITPALNFNGAGDPHLRRARRQRRQHRGATQSYTVTAVNDAPTGTPTAVLADGTEDTAYTVSAADLLAGFADVDGDTLVVANLATSNGSRGRQRRRHLHRHPEPQLQRHR